MSPSYALRLAGPDDIELLFTWRNDPWGISLSSSQRTVTWEEHAAWYPSALDRSRRLLFIVYADRAMTTPAGMARVDRGEDGDGVISIFLTRLHTGRGIGPRVIDDVSHQAFARWADLRRIVACIQAGNAPSVKAFARAGYRHDGDVDRCPDGHLQMSRRRPGGHEP